LKDPWEVIQMVCRQIFVEILEKKDPEALARLAEVAEELMESARNSTEKSFAMGVLAAATVIIKKWRFGFDKKSKKPFVEVEYVFDRIDTAEAMWKSFRIIGIKARKRAVKINGRDLPAVVVDWRRHREVLTEFGLPATPLDIVAFEYIKQKSCEHAMAILAKYIVFMTLLGTVDRLEECEQ